ncbi:T9SS type A sorting domain-containing protein [Sanyastnella coralliicola]|uniref:T9SS type A sorting domain-containing protein n=1 Tax=Sanyastnella coralliicola TaxID=3069118 RepID=UPI0027B9BEA8|nr:T9SS type A sorting domain-containing protein [Longitalea sp. SCSIO 12813]
MRIRTLLSAILMLFAIGANAQIVINEFQPDLDQVEIKNLGMMEVPVGNYFLCSFPIYTEIEDMTIVSGDLNLGPGEILVVSGHEMGDSDDELGLYILPQYSNSGAIIDYVEWGSSGHVRANVAIGAAIWSMGDFIPTVNAGESVQWDGEGDTSGDWFLGDDTFGAENLGGCDAEGGTISTDDPTEICAGDGEADPINVTLEGASGSNSAWVITDDQANILALPEGSPFDLEGAGGGVCLIWHLSFEDGLIGAEVGMNANDLEGCFSLSNAITVTRNGVAGGTLSTINDDNTFEICAGDGVADPIEVTLEGAEGQNSQYVITDDLGNILALPEGAGPFDLEGAGGGTCLIWHLSFEDGLEGAEVGMNANDLEGCYSLSNPVTVIRNGVAGGTISTEDETTICALDGEADPINVTLEGAEGSNFAWVITDDLGNILDLPANGPFDFDGAGEGVCLIWHLSFEDGLEGAEVGMNANDLEGCYSLSNPITVTRLVGDQCDCEAEGGTISTEDPTEICAGDGVADPINVTLEGASGSNSAWVITDDQGNILALPAGSPFNLEGAGGGVCLIWHLSFEDGLVGAEVGMNANDLEGCYSLSNAITVTRNGVAGGTLSTINDDNTFEICAGDGVADPIDVTLEGAEGQNSQYVITDDLGNILALPEGAGPFDLEGAGGGTCLIWHLSFEDGLEGAEVGMNANDLEGCYSLSNPVTVIRNGVAGGTISTEDPTTICALDDNPDPINVTLEGAEGSNSAWVITDDLGNILGLPEGGPFDLDGAGEGICLIWHLSFEDGLEGAEVGMNANDLEGCYSLSNPITVTRLVGEDCDCIVDGGTLTTENEDNTFEICAGDGVADPIDVTLSGAIGTNSAWVITDDAANILALPAGPPFDLEGAGGGTCLIWHLSFEDGLIGAEVGMNANDLEGCHALSNPVTVIRNGVNGGVLTTDNEDNTFEICAGDGIADPIDVTLEGNEGQNSQWVITDDEGNILALPAGGPFDLDGAGPGTCLIWHLSFEDGLTGAEVGMNANDLDGCYSLSNPVTVIRNGIAGGTVSTSDGETMVTVIVGDGDADEFEFASAESEGENFVFIVTDPSGEIIDILDGNTADFEGAPAGICYVYGFSYYGTLEAEVENNIADITSTGDCFQISENFVTIDRQPVGVYEVRVNALNAWPNPVNEAVTIELPEAVQNAQLTIYNTQGQIVLTTQMSGSGNQQVDVSQLATGAYHLHLTNGDQTYRVALLKQ